ncbi:protein phosphatase 2C domain-containing protein [Cytobacillus gottheilii]|uniref:protein phosphatase 2C domain-containing protein n=1 Tax=Cytobacillus gottheilii TaxID=859144 RepID=UPI0009BA6D61|nr:protein phosphatase 2C domain-containing protein [Cytobacillus gottheilii]
MNKYDDFKWIGSQETFIDTPNLVRIHSLSLGRFGGHSSAGQAKNEDGCLIWCDEKEDWEFVILLDAHHSAESAQLILDEFEKEKSTIKNVLSEPIRGAFKKLEQTVLQLFHSEEFIASCQQVTGETACLIVFRKDQYVWWFSVGDCVFYLFHKELAALGQFAVNQRQFYEWIGRVNTFEQEVPCYSVGIRELRTGENRLFLTTDGLLECPNEPYAHPIHIYNSFVNSKNDTTAMLSMLKVIQHNHVKDSTTMVTWKINNNKEAAQPSL